jgi:hypothetical protein
LGSGPVELRAGQGHRSDPRHHHAAGSQRRSTPPLSRARRQLVASVRRSRHH